MRRISLIDDGVSGDWLKFIIILIGDNCEDDWSIITKRINWVGVSRSVDVIGTFPFKRKRAHCKVESLKVETRGNWSHTIVNVSCTKNKH